MALPMLLALTIAPALLGTQEAIRQSQSKNKREEHRSRRCNLVVSCVKPSIRSRDINGRLVVLRDHKLYITTTAVPTGEEDEEVVDSTTPADAGGYPFSGYFLPYPDASYEGVVSTISDDPPMLNWIYVDRDTYEVRYGVRALAQDNVTGPFDCTRQDRRMTLEGWEGFCAVEEFPGVWALYFDRDDDGLAAKVPMGTRVLEVELTRREKKERKPKPGSGAQTLDEKMRELKGQTRREEAEREEMMRQATEQEQQQQREQGLSTARGGEASGQQQMIDIRHVGPTEKEAEEEEEEEEEAKTEPPVVDVRSSLKIDTIGETYNTSVEAHHRLPGGVITSPSAATDAFSFWSGVRGRDGGALDSAVSATAASSVVEGHDPRGDGSSEGQDEEQLYKQPYVEDDLCDPTAER